MSETLSWEILARDRMSEVLEKLAAASSKLERSLAHTGSEAKTMGRQLEEAEPKANRFNSGLERVHATAGRLVSFISGVATGAIATFAAQGLAELAEFGIKAAADNETARVSFDLLLGSGEASLAFLHKLQAFAAATPFDMPSLREAASRLLAVGVNADDVIPIMTRLGDATAGMGTGAEGIQRAVYALQQMKQSGRVQLDDINQLTDAGIPALDALAAHFHTTVAKIRDEISGGKIKADDLFAAIEKGEGPAFARLQGMMAKQSATLSGMWSTFKDNASQAIAAFVEPAMPKLKKLLDFAAQAVPQAIAGIQNYGGRIADIFKGSDVAEKLGASIRKVAGEIGKFAHGELEDLIKTIAKNKDGLEKFGHFIANDVIPILGFLVKTSIKGLVTVLEVLISTIAFVGEHFQQAKRIVVTAWQGVVDFVLGGIKLIIDGAAAGFGWIPGLGPKLKSAAAEFDSFYNHVNNYLDRLAGRSVDVWVNTHVTGPGTAAIVTPGGGFNTTGGGMRAFASGGTWDGPAVMRVGENGPEELYVGGPGKLRPNNLLGTGSTPSTSNQYTINVNAGMGTDGVSLGAQIVEAIRQYELVAGRRWRTI